MILCPPITSQGGTVCTSATPPSYGTSMRVDCMWGRKNWGFMHEVI